jgi:PAS domain S-box-containing protein
MNDKVNVLLVDDQPAKLLANEEILRDLGENLIKTSSAREALEFLLKNDAAVVLIDVCMPELDGFQLAAMIRDHPRFQRTAIIFISAIQVDDVDRLRGYEMGAVDYVPVPVVPAVLRAKVKVFAELYRKTRDLERFNSELERRVAERTAELEASTARLLHSEQQLRLATEAAEIGLWDVDNVTDTLFWPPLVKAMFGISPDIPVSMADFYAGLHPDDKEATVAAYAAACDPDERALYDVEYRTVGKEDEVIRWVEAKGRGVFDADGKCVRVVGTAIDITKRKEAEGRQDLLAREVDHRARNALAVVQSIVRLTRASSVEGYVAAVEGRIKALARAHALLSDSRWHGADLDALVMEELAPYRLTEAEKVKISGPKISLLPHMAQGLALALHEMATNAAKHGALSSMAGKVTVTWQAQPTSLVLQWVETGGPRIAPPPTRSFGLNVIRASIESQLGGKATFDWNLEGMRCTLLIPRHETTIPTPSQKTGNGAEKGQAPAKIAYGRRVLVVEDEALVAMMIQEFLTEYGHSVVGPIGRASDALVAAKETDYDAAILDINLGDGMAYPVAEIVAARGVPFVFVTGYEADTVDDRFSHIPVLQKPIERQALQRLFVTGLSDGAVAAAAGSDAAKGRARA